MAAHHASSQPLDQLDPHHEEHHGHVILPAFTLVTVLLILLFFTALTVFLSRFEIWAGAAFMVEIPNWVNIMIVLSIATVKGVLVGMYFMQLKYDHPINSVIFLFCLFAFALFLGFTMLDLGTRNIGYRYEGEEIQAGGQGIVTGYVNTGGKPLAVFWREAEILRLQETYGPEEGTRRYWEKFELAHGASPPIPEARRIPSDPNVSRPRSGLTPGLFDEAAAEEPVRRRGWRGGRDVAEPAPADHGSGGH